jgi:hypothetical protein
MTRMPKDSDHDEPLKEIVRLRDQVKLTGNAASILMI